MRFAVGLLVGFEKITMGAETIFAGDGVFENRAFQRQKCEGHVSTKEHKTAYSREISGPVGNGRLVDNKIKSELSQNDGSCKGKNIYGENWLFGGSSVGVENKGNEKGDDEKAC